MEEVYRKVLNDGDVFDSPYDRRRGNTIPKLFENQDWKKLGNLFRNMNKDEYERMIQKRVQEIRDQEKSNRNGYRGKRIEELERLADSLKMAYETKPSLLKQLFETLNWYGLVECKLPAMEDFGKVIERYEMSVVEQFFSDKISKANYVEKKALKKVLEYVKELYESGSSLEEIAYFARKLESLKEYWKVIK
jgi:hypothetical protein